MYTVFWVCLHCGKSGSVRVDRPAPPAGAAPQLDDELEAIGEALLQVQRTHGHGAHVRMVDENDPRLRRGQWVN